MVHDIYGEEIKENLKNQEWSILLIDLYYFPNTLLPCLCAFPCGEKSVTVRLSSVCTVNYSACIAFFFEIKTITTKYLRPQLLW